MAIELHRNLFFLPVGGGDNKRYTRNDENNNSIHTEYSILDTEYLFFTLSPGLRLREAVFLEKSPVVDLWVMSDSPVLLLLGLPPVLEDTF